LQITDRTRTKGIATVNINNTTGQVTGVTINTAPSGYDALSLQLEPMFAGAPGTGALIVANTTTDVNSKEVTLGSISVTSGGSGYRSNVNRNNQNPAIGGIPALKPGQTYVVNIELGTGERKLLVN
jgi:glycerate kinase